MQRQGLCCLKLLQHTVDGGAVDVNAGRHGINCEGLQVTASATGNSLENTAVASSSADDMKMKAPDTLLLFFFMI